MNAIDSTHFCKSCGNIAYRQSDNSFWCGRCSQSVLVMSVPPNTGWVTNDNGRQVWVTTATGNT